MAIVFISPKRKQGAFFWGILTLFILFLMIISSIILLPEFLNKDQNVTPEVSFKKSSAIINLDIIDSDKVKNLKPFNRPETVFTYIAQDQNGAQITGNISATTKENAKKLLEASGFKVLSLKEMNIGRNEPFISY